MNSEQQTALLRKMAHMMQNGLKTQTEPFPETEREFAAILDELRRLDPGDPVAVDHHADRLAKRQPGRIEHPHVADPQRPV